MKRLVITIDNEGKITVRPVGAWTYRSALLALEEAARSLVNQAQLDTIIQKAKEQPSAADAEHFRLLREAGV